jgi:phosphoketolase
MTKRREDAEKMATRAAELMKEKNNPYSGDVVKAFMGEVTTKEAKKALETLDELAELILFHAKIRENAKNIMDTWEM